MAETKEPDLFYIQETELQLSNNFAQDPDKYLAKLGGRKRLRDMTYDDEVSTALDTRLGACRGIDWVIESDSQQVYDFIFPQIDKHYNKLLESIWGCIPYGYSVFQAVYKQDNGIQIDQIHDESFELFTINTDNELLPYYTNRLKKDQLYPEKFFFTVRKQSSMFPMGEPLLASIYFAWLFKRNGWDFYMSFLESYGKPFMHVLAKDASDETKDIVKAIVNAKRPRSVSTGENIDIKLIESTRNTDAFDRFQKSMTERIQRAILGQTLTSGTDGAGSYALGLVHNEIRMERVISDCEIMLPTIQKLINTICDLNGIKEYPSFKFIYPKPFNIQQVDRDLKLKSLGVKFTKDYISDNYDIDLDKFEIVENQVNPFSFSQKKDDDDEYFGDFPNKKHKCFELTKDEEAQIRAQERLENSAIEQAGQVLSTEEMVAIIKNSKTKKELENRLSYYINIESPEYDDALTQLLFQSRLKGYVDGYPEE